MRGRSYLILLIASLALANCVRTPAPDVLANGPTIDQIVQRVKCELYASVKDPLNAPYGYEWLHNWTSQVNLNLIVNDQSQIAPGAVFTQPLTTESIPLRVANMARSWNFGLGAQLSNTATRNEAITFTVSMDELQRQLQNNPDCSLPNFIDLESDLGLKDWIAASFSPVENGYLSSGYHKPPKPPSGGAPKTAQVAVSNANKSVQTFQTTRALLPPNPQLDQDLQTVLDDLAVVDKYDFKNLDGPKVERIAKTVVDIQALIRDLGTEHMNCKTRPKDIRCRLEHTAIALAVFLDPPIDALSHQVQFIILLNASANPSWTLLHFKGPAPTSGSMLSASKTSTHTLNIVLGPPGSPDVAGAVSALQIGTAVSNAVNALPTVNVIH